MKTLCIIIFIYLRFYDHVISAEPVTKINPNPRPVIVLNSAAEAPYTTVQQDGFLNELATEMFSAIGYDLHVDKLPAERALRRANNGLIDGEIVRVAGLNKTYPNLIPVPGAIMVMNFVVFSKKTINLQQGWAALENKEIAFITGWKIFEKKVPKTSSITKTSNAQELFKLLEKNRIDLILYNRWSGYYMINKLQLKNIYLQLPVLAKKDMFMYLHKKHQALVPKLTAALATIKKDGRYQGLVHKHLSPLE